MIRMHVSTNNPFYGFVLHEAAKQAFPLGLRTVQIEAGIDNGPAIVILKEPEINVV